MFLNGVFVPNNVDIKLNTSILYAYLTYFRKQICIDFFSKLSVRPAGAAASWPLAAGGGDRCLRHHRRRRIPQRRQGVQRREVRHHARRVRTHTRVSVYF